jgi:hypothetical protein
MSPMIDTEQGNTLFDRTATINKMYLPQQDVNNSETKFHQPNQNLPAFLGTITGGRPTVDNHSTISGINLSQQQPSI